MLALRAHRGDQGLDLALRDADVQGLAALHLIGAAHDGAVAGAAGQRVASAEDGQGRERVEARAGRGEAAAARLE